MPKASFNFGTAEPHTMEVSYSWWGREEYYLDGSLLERRLDLSFSGQREFRIGAHSVRIEVSTPPKQYFTRVFVDDKLHVDELFPEFKARAEKWNGSCHPVLLILAALAGVIAGIWRSTHPEHDKIDVAFSFGPLTDLVIGVAIFGSLIGLVIAGIRSQIRRTHSARASFAATANDHSFKDYQNIAQVSGESLAWVSSATNTYTLRASQKLVAKLYLTSSGDLVGATWSEGHLTVEGRGSFGAELKLRRAQSGIEDAAVHVGYKVITLPSGRQYHCKTGGFWKPAWRLQDSTGVEIFSLIPKGKVLNIQSQAYALAELPLLLIMGGYIMIVDLDYSADD
jgi:hypothetical protein